MAAAGKTPPDFMERLGRVRLLSLDVDGVMTDGGLYFTDDGLTLRKFNVKDGFGIRRLLDNGFEIAVISAGPQEAIRRRMESLGLRHIFTAVENKLETLTGLCTKLGFDLDQVAHMGDDLNDLPVMEKVGLAIAVVDAMPEVCARAAYVTRHAGGAGAVREVCDLLYAARKAGS